MKNVNERLDRFKVKHAELKEIIEKLSDKATDEPRWAFVEAMEELEKDVEESIRQGIRRIYDLKQIAKHL
jgi:predicted nuclease with TOPRIM domain